tara:strand:- start:4609 stop:4734 length:126 start_codon:yes stop_codon:yes gene_type:complete
MERAQAIKINIEPIALAWVLFLWHQVSIFKFMETFCLFVVA